VPLLWLQDYFADLVKQFLAVEQSNNNNHPTVQLVFIGSGAVGLGHKLYKRVVGEHKHRQWS
jgi:hypothetical protein